MPLAKGMYTITRSPFCVGEGYSQKFEVKVGDQQGSLFSPLLFIMVREALSGEFSSGGT